MSKIKNKALVSFITIVIIIVSMGSFGYAQSVYYIPNVTFCGEFIDFDQSPVIIDGRLLIPIRAVAEKMGALIIWEPRTGTTTITKDDIVISLQNGSKEFFVFNKNNSLTKKSEFLDVAPRIYNGRTLLPLRAVIEALGYQITWDANTNVASIEEGGTLKVTGLDDTQSFMPMKWAYIPSVQQFYYRETGMAYAYVSQGKLIIQMPTKQFKLDLLHPLIGDVLSDDAGNFYVVWGQPNENSNTPKETVLISKYTSEGQHIKTTGFVGTSSPWKNSDLAKTQIPFDAGNCVSVIADGKLINYHGKKRYDGHQSDQVIGVNIETMEPITLTSNSFSGHSFNQSLIYHKASSNFLFASQGDAYPRGFKVNTISGNYGEQRDVLFSFYLQQNANYDMFVVNETFAQLGGIVETSSGVALVGASAKSIGEEAKKEPQNLFMQVFNPMLSSMDSSKFIGGEVRSGATSFDINDNQNQPLSTVTDYGVRWLTKYKDKNVISPQVVVANDKVVIMWSIQSVSNETGLLDSVEQESFYMIMSNTGDVIKDATSLGKTPLNSMERPIYHDGFVHWVSVVTEGLKVRSLKID